MPIIGKVIAVKEGKKGIKGLNINIDSATNGEIWCVGPNIKLDHDVNIGCSVHIIGRWIHDEEGKKVYYAVEAITFL